MLKKHMGDRAAIAIAVGALAPPPFPYTLVIAAASAFDYSLWRILVVNFFGSGRSALQEFWRFWQLSLAAIFFKFQNPRRFSGPWRFSF